ncbi:MAG: O-antigen ligase family protein [Actinomycetia bacterium]|nr:O-antigen ligase family protein [Actinomycetes bacterium]
MNLSAPAASESEPVFTPSVGGSATERFLRVQHIIALISCVVIAISVVFARRKLFFIPGKVPLIYFASVFTMLWGLGVFAWVLRHRRSIDIRLMLREAWALLLYYAVSMALLVIVLIRARFSSAILHMTFNYWVLYPAVPLAWLMGKVSGKQARKVLPVLMLTLASIGFIVSAGELLAAFGHANPIGDLIVWYNRINLPLASWTWNHTEALRIIGYSFDPNYFAFFALIGIIWALCGRDRIVLRLIVLAENSFMLFFSASRGVFVTFLIVLIVWALVYRRWFGALFRGRRASSITLIIVVVVLVAAVFSVAARGPLSSMVSRMGSAVSAVQKQGFTTETLDLLSNGRGALWGDALRLIQEKPLGHWLAERQLSKISFHNDYLVMWVTGGPLLFFAFILLLVWMGRRRTPSSNRGLPLLLALTCALTSFFYNIFQFGAVLPLVFFILGVYAQSRGKAVATDG